MGLALALSLNATPAHSEIDSTSFPTFEQVTLTPVNSSLPIGTETTLHINPRPASLHPVPTSAPMHEAKETVHNDHSTEILPVAPIKTIKIHRRPQATPAAVTAPAPIELSLEDMRTNWGFGNRENQYNATIFKAAQQHWPHKNVPLSPLLLKSLIATESAFNPTAVSYSGATGLTQLTPDSVRRFGLNWSTARDPQYSVPAGVKVLAEKARVILEPENYSKITGLKPEKCPYAQVVAEAYQKLGTPNAEQSWHLVLGAYNAGGGTILRAMAKAYKQGLDPREWDNLVGDPDNMTQAPLYRACQEVFPYSTSSKYKEISQYPKKIMKLYKSQPRGVFAI